MHCQLFFTETFDKHAPKKPYIRYNHKPFINNEISKAIIEVC